MEMPEKHRQEPDRRGFLIGTLMGTGIAMVAGALYPLTRYFFPPEKKASAKSGGITLPLSSLHTGSASFIKVKGKPAIVIRKSETEVVALSAVCTHLGCIVKYQDGELKCPCHGASFDSGGKVLGGPAPSGLIRYSVTLDSDMITIEEPEGAA